MGVFYTWRIDWFGVFVRSYKKTKGFWKKESIRQPFLLLVQVRLYLVIGEVVQVERNTLGDLDKTWLIYGQEVQEDLVIVRTISMLY